MSTASIAGKTGPQTTATTHVFSNLKQANFNFPNNLLTVVDGDIPGPTDIALTGSNTITLTVTGSVYTLTIT